MTKAIYNNDYGLLYVTPLEETESFITFDIIEHDEDVYKVRMANNGRLVAVKI